VAPRQASHPRQAGRQVARRHQQQPQQAAKPRQQQVKPRQAVFPCLAESSSNAGSRSQVRQRVKVCGPGRERQNWQAGSEAWQQAGARCRGEAGSEQRRGRRRRNNGRQQQQIRRWIPAGETGYKRSTAQEYRQQPARTHSPVASSIAKPVMQQIRNPECSKRQVSQQVNETKQVKPRGGANRRQCGKGAGVTVG